LYDMHGNVCEWCSYSYSRNYYASSPATDPRGHDSGPFRVLRGGSWYSGLLNIRCADRCGCIPADRNGYNGLRVVLE
jgi:formylglycine-generating enzyme required for sulfatase activity